MTALNRPPVRSDRRTRGFEWTEPKSTKFQAADFFVYTNNQKNLTGSSLIGPTSFLSAMRPSSRDQIETDRNRRLFFLGCSRHQKKVFPLVVGHHLRAFSGTTHTHSVCRDECLRVSIKFNSKKFTKIEREQGAPLMNLFVNIKERHAV
jgi:hypothetical protein